MSIRLWYMSAQTLQYIPSSPLHTALSFLKALIQPPAVTLHYRTQSCALSDTWACTVTYTMCPHSCSGLRRGDEASVVELRYMMSHLSVSADNPGGRQWSGQDLSAGSVWPGQVHPRVLHCHCRHWFHSESTLPALYEPSTSTLNVICIHFFLSHPLPLYSCIFSPPFPVVLLTSVLRKTWQRCKSLSPYVSEKCNMNQWCPPVWDAASSRCINLRSMTLCACVGGVCILIANDAKAMIELLWRELS